MIHTKRPELMLLKHPKITREEAERIYDEVAQ